MRLVMSSVSVSTRESTSAPPTKWRGDKGQPQPTGPLAIFCVRWSNAVRFKAWYLERCWPREFGRTVERPLPPEKPDIIVTTELGLLSGMAADSERSSGLVRDFRTYRVRRRLQMSYALQNACQRENERISTMPFLLWHFSPGDKIENCPAQLSAQRNIAALSLIAARNKRLGCTLA